MKRGRLRQCAVVVLGGLAIACSGSSTAPSVDGGGPNGELPESVAFEWFISGQGPESAVIGVMPLDGSSSPVALTTPDENRDWWARPSPDGQKILFERDAIGHLGSLTESIWVMNADGSNQTRIMSIADGDEENNPNGFTSFGHAEWTRDGQSIVFSADGPATSTFAIWTMDANGGNQRQITSGQTLSIDPSVCADGRILFIQGSLFPVANEIFIMDADGANLTQVSSDVAAGRAEQADYDPYCSPDGTRIISLRQISLLSWNNVLQSVDGSTWTTVADGADDSTSYGVARWIGNDLVVSSRVGAGGIELVTYEPDNPAIKTVLLPANGPNRFRDPAPF